ncbi:GNAT family N-acetyltransferase [Wenxinia marina]|uniref:Wenxma_19, whole genome shotgun sequence n=1 Tax=Wenxinia marina DSM 24838 TaxID=1123501 RepID=A0A0D0PZI0_9RHOB|nr:GNAT family N-acetyltransferase [Wenxinia marina]KIQ67749.1 Acetyltransferase [Wenxinia marina DSM 24838]GGL77531.1 N-acetyltransferase [Wenxinia marina]
MLIDTVTDQPAIPAERFVLRPPRRSDQGLIELYASDERVAKMTRSIPHPLPPGAVEAFIRQALSPDRREDVWIIDGSAHGASEIMGVVSLQKMERGQSEIGYWVAPAFWNTGVASEAVRALVEANPTGAATIFAEVFQDNPNSARVLTGCGFEYLGDAEAYSVSRKATVQTWTYLLKPRK